MWWKILQAGIAAKDRCGAGNRNDQVQISKVITLNKYIALFNVGCR
jgi:hypothetical protein